LINTRTDEPFNIDAALSAHGHAYISACGHASILSRQPDGFYYLIDPQGSSEGTFYSKACPLLAYFKKQIPEGSSVGVHETNDCYFQTTRPVCFLWSIMFLCTPELTDGKLRKIIESVAESYAYTVTTNEKGEEDWNFSQADKDHFYKNLDIYVIAVMEEFVKSNQAMTAEEYSEARLTAGKRRTRRRKLGRKRKTHHKKLRNR
jgi:hypothetical protein